MRRAFIVASVLAATCWYAPPSQASQPPQEVSLVALLANPQSYEGKFVRVEGFFDGTHFESCRLYLNKADFDQVIIRNSIYVEWRGCRDRNAAAKVQARYAMVEGVFQADIGSDIRSYSAIRDVQRLEVTKSRMEYERSWRAPWWLAAWPGFYLGVLFVAVATTATYLIAKRFLR